MMRASSGRIGTLGKKSKLVESGFAASHVNVANVELQRTNRAAPRLRGLYALSADMEGGRHGTLVFGQAHVVFVEGPEVDSAASGTTLCALLPYELVLRYAAGPGGVSIAVQGGTNEFVFRTDHAVDARVWNEECLLYLDTQIMRYQRESAPSSTWLVTLLWGVAAPPEVEESLRELQGEETLLFEKRILDQRPTALSAEAVFISGRRFVARWRLGKVLTPCVLVVTSQGLVVLLAEQLLFLCLFWDDISSYGVQKKNLVLKHCPPQHEPSLFSFALPDVALLQQALGDAMAAARPADAGSMMRTPTVPVPLPLLYPPSVPEYGRRVGEAEPGGEAEADRKRTERQKTMRKQMTTIHRTLGRKANNDTALKVIGEAMGSTLDQ